MANMLLPFSPTATLPVQPVMHEFCEDWWTEGPEVFPISPDEPSYAHGHTRGQGPFFKLACQMGDRDTAIRKILAKPTSMFMAGESVGHFQLIVCAKITYECPMDKLMSDWCCEYGIGDGAKLDVRRRLAKCDSCGAAPNGDPKDVVLLPGVGFSFKCDACKTVSVIAVGGGSNVSMARPPNFTIPIAVKPHDDIKMTVTLPDGTRLGHIVRLMGIAAERTT